MRSLYSQIATGLTCDRKRVEKIIKDAQDKSDALRTQVSPYWSLLVGALAEAYRS